MLKIAVYGKGGIGKSTISSNLSVALSERGYKVMQIGCDPKADSTIQLHQGHTVTSILDIIRARGDKAGLDELVTEGSGGVLCAEAGGPTPGMGCAGRGLSLLLRRWRRGMPLRSISRTRSSTTCWATWSAEALPCLSGKGMRTRYLS